MRAAAATLQTSPNTEREMDPKYYLYMADAVAVVHLMVLAYVVVGQLLIVIAAPCRWQWARNPWFRASHLGVIAYVVYEQFYSIRCFLSVWEEKLKVLGGVDPFAANETFVGRLVSSLFKFDIPQDHPFFYALYIGMFVVVLQGLVMYPPRMFRRSELLGVLTLPLRLFRSQKPATTTPSATPTPAITVANG